MTERFLEIQMSVCRVEGTVAVAEHVLNVY
jgi:hypothetical protein